MSKSTKHNWLESYQITSLLVNPQGRLGLYGTLNLLQETAWMHAENLGFGISDMERDGLYWVLTRQALKMHKWPRFGAKVQIETWLRPPEGAFVTREFSLTDEDGHEIGTCSTSWLALSRETKKIIPIQNLRPWEEVTLAKTSGLTPEKIPVTGEYEILAKFRVRNSDLDINQHVNNTKYAQWILDSIPYDLHKKLKLNSYSVNFLAETHLGDKVQIERNCSTPPSEQIRQGHSSYKGVRTSDGKVLFTAILGWEHQS